MTSPARLISRIPGEGASVIPALTPGGAASVSQTELYASTSLDTRAAFVSAAAFLAPLVRVGSTVAAEGLLYRRVTGATAITDLPGWVPAGPIDAGHFGFSAAAGSASSNAAALQAAVAYSAGANPVLVRCPVNYQCNQVTFTNTAVWLTFDGPGDMDRTASNTGALRVIMDFLDVQSAALSDETITLNGNTEPVTAVTVADASKFPRGTTVKIVSDDIDPDARVGYTARRGEVAKVHTVDLVANKVYLAKNLEDRAFYTSNIRIVRMQDKKVDIRGFGVRSVETNSERLITIQGVIGGYVEARTRSHGNICMQGNGCVRSAFVVPKGESLGASEGAEDVSLGYLYSDACGTDNELRALRGAFARHCVTTAFTSEAPGSTNYHNYGAPRDLTVIDCISEGAQGKPFDEHEGARRTKFINCKARNGLNGVGANSIAFQLRGRDSTIINADVDASYDGAVQPSEWGRGVHQVIGGTFRCPLIFTGLSAGYKAPIVFAHPNVSLKMNSLTSRGLIRGGGAGCNITLRGGVYQIDFNGISSGRVITAEYGTQIELDGPEFIVSGAMNNNRIGYIGDTGGKIIGDFSVRSAMATPPNLIFSAASSTGAGVRADLTIKWLEGARPTTLSSGTFDELIYSMRDYAVSPSVYLSSGDVMASYAGALDISGNVAMQMATPSSMRLRGRGTDGVTRFASIPLIAEGTSLPTSFDIPRRNFLTSASWIASTTPAPGGIENQWCGMAWSPQLGLFAAVSITGTGNRVMTSPDGITWTAQVTPADNDWRSICWSPELGLFCAVSITGTGNRVMTSPDGVTWTLRTSAADNDWQAICWSPQLRLFVAVASTGTGNRVMTSPDGITWTARTSAVDNGWRAVCWSPDRYIFCAVSSSGTGNRVMTSPDGITWTARTSAADNNWYAICWASEIGRFVVVAETGTGNRVMTSSTGTSGWATRTSAADNNWNAICWASEIGLLIAIGRSGTGNRVMTSPDGITWTARTSAADNNWYAVAWAGQLGLAAAVGISGTGNRAMTSKSALSLTYR